MSFSISRPRRVLISPFTNDSRVVTASHDIRIYKHSPSTTTQFQHVVSLSDPILQGWKCISWCTDPSFPDIIGIGLYSGKIVLVRIPSANDVDLACSNDPINTSSPLPVVLPNTSLTGIPTRTPGSEFTSSSYGMRGFGPNACFSQLPNKSPSFISTSFTNVRSTAPISSSIVSEFSLRYPRTCHALDFNPVDPSLFLSGHEKARNEPGIFIWDLHFQTQSSSNRLSQDSLYPIESSSSVEQLSHLSTQSITFTPHLRNTSSNSSSGDSRRLSYHRDFAVMSRPGFGSMALSASNAGEDTHIQQQTNQVNNRYSMPGTLLSRTQPSVPLYQLGASESVSSVIWLRQHARLILAGMGLKSLRLFDLRSGTSTSPVQEYNTRSVFGVVADPFSDYQFASYSDDAIVKVWDTRKPSSYPVLDIPSHLPTTPISPTISHIAYSSNRSGTLGVMYKDTPGICIYELIHASSTFDSSHNKPGISNITQVPLDNQTDHSYMSVLRRRTCKTGLPTAFSFAPTDEKGTCQLVVLSRPLSQQGLPTLGVNGSSTTTGFGASGGRMLAPVITPINPHHQSSGLGSNTGTSPSSSNTSAIPTAPPATISPASGEYRLEHVQLPDTPQAAWNPNGSLAAANHYNANAITFTDPNSTSEDLLSSMKSRALTGYTMNVHDNLALVQQHVVHAHKSDSTAMGSMYGLVVLWQWIGRMEQLVSNGRVTIGGLDFSWLGVQRILQGLTGNVSNTTNHPFSTIYTSPQRRLALNFCGWFGREELEKELQRLEQAKLYEKATLCAFLHSDLPRAIQSLLASKDEKLHLVSAVIAGYTADPQPTWIQMCKSLSQELAQFELRVIFTYFATNDWCQVVREPLELHEKLLVALRYFNDLDLLAYVEKQTAQAVFDGDLYGILLTGLSPEGVTLMQRYVDNSGDVQTAALALSYAVPRRFSDSRVSVWVEEYRDYLDQQQMYHTRAYFDIAIAKVAGLEHVDVAPQIQMRCNFCNQSISNHMFLPGIKDRDGRRVAFPASALGSVPKPKITSCPNCRKSLPRCSLCLLSIGSPIDIQRRGDTPSSPDIDPSSRKMKIHGVSSTSEHGGFESWFTWCQTCKHGGHASHILEWFGKHRICPVADWSVPTFDTIHFVQRLEQHGFTSDQSEAVMLSFHHVIRESMANLKSTMVTKGEQEKNVHMYKVDFTALKSEIKMLEKNDYAILRTETERLTSELERLKQRMREETNRLQAGIRLDMNLEKGRIRDETSIQESKIRDAHARVDSEIANIRTQLESIKYEIIRNVVGTLTAAGGLVLGSLVSRNISSKKL